VQTLNAVSILILATRNLHKAQEIRAILGPEHQVLTLTNFPGAPEVMEDAATFAGNATKKAVEVARWLSSRRSAGGVLAGANPVFVLADDSGLEVDALNGAPGVHSARFAALDCGGAGNSTSTENNAKLLRLLARVPSKQRTARFRCVLALTPVLAHPPASASPARSTDEFELHTRLFDGVCEGRITLAPRGEGGFGYDPLFEPAGYEQTFGELGEAVKNSLSHRARALDKLRNALEPPGMTLFLLL
jgi:XTP/dITP diphosphohydrolase